MYNMHLSEIFLINCLMFFYERKFSFLLSLYYIRSNVDLIDFGAYSRCGDRFQYIKLLNKVNENKCKNYLINMCCL